ncbi:receptor activity-modifying protein 1 [Nelusetta ayraudi]|uniref:receptor activity-modifying protein 1 n=1 Tax=Nelusetta ayraudi TaxID=303726 RepID=UPI003F6E8144
MILHLLVLLLSLGAVELQAANMTREVLRNQTFTDGNYTLRSRNGTFNSTEDERSQLEDRIKEIIRNETSDAITEDDETFQEQETMFSSVIKTKCHRDQLEIYGHRWCVYPFHQAMTLISPEDWCVLENVIRPYNEMTLCLEQVSKFLGCFFPNSQIQDFFFSIHSQYFHNCTKEEDQDIIDPPEEIMVTLILVPVSLIPILIYMVVRNSKVQE